MDTGPYIFPDNCRVGWFSPSGVFPKRRMSPAYPSLFKGSAFQSPARLANEQLVTHDLDPATQGSFSQGPKKNAVETIQLFEQ